MKETQSCAIRVDRLNHSFGVGEVGKQVLFDNSVEVMAGELVIVMGPSGSGKTTLLTLLGALRTVQDGSVEVLGQQLRGLNGAELMAVRRRIGFIFQGHNLFRSLTAVQNVKTALQLQELTRADSHRRAVQVLTRLGMDDRLHYKPDALSGGQKQRVAIARALVNQPQLILADEPTAALDRDSGRQVVTLLQSLAREAGCTIIMVTHDNRILDVADRVINLVDGRIASNQLRRTYQLSRVSLEDFSRVSGLELLHREESGRTAHQDRQAEDGEAPGERH